mmetsp:Transcript_7119/g.20967  ORF Transcript_7119/g.20967 Transcript_7119/m.20967 type:complete len:169 (-) Transcript_7119:33-539(-)
MGASARVEVAARNALNALASGVIMMRLSKVVVALALLLTPADGFGALSVDEDMAPAGASSAGPSAEPSLQPSSQPSKAPSAGGCDGDSCIFGTAGQCCDGYMCERQSSYVCSGFLCGWVESPVCAALPECPATNDNNMYTCLGPTDCQWCTCPDPLTLACPSGYCVCE